MSCIGSQAALGGADFASYMYRWLAIESLKAILLITLYGVPKRWTATFAQADGLQAGLNHLYGVPKRWTMVKGNASII